MGMVLTVIKLTVSQKRGYIRGPASVKEKLRPAGADAVSRLHSYYR
jgi:hypothetical protein